MTVSEAQKAATTKWEKENYDKILVRVPAGTRERWKAAADRHGESLNGYIVKAVQERTDKQK